MRPEPLAEPRRTSPLAAVFGIVGPDRIRTFLPLLVIALSSGRIVPALAIVGVIGIAIGVAAWWRRTWSFGDGVLRLDEGLVTRNQRRIPVERIQHVELERRLRHQIFDLAAVRVETAGGAGAELVLDPIPLAEAETLRATILETLRDVAASDDPIDADAPPPPPPAPPEVLVRLPPGRLLLSGITGPEVAAVLAALAVGVDFLLDLGVDPDDVDGADLSRALVVLLVVVAVPVWLLVAGLVGLVRRWDLTATIVDDELRVTYGLLRKAEFVVKTPRVQDARIAHRMLLRPFDRADLRVRTAASGSGDQSRVDIPLLSPAEIDRILGRLLPDAVPRPVLVPAPPAARRRAHVRGAVLGALLGAGLVALASTAVGWAGLVLLPVGVAAGVGRGELAYRGLGAGRNGTDGAMFHSRAGTLTRHHAIVPAGRIQSGAVVASFFQRRRGLATTRFDLAGAAVAVIDRAADEADRVLAAATGGPGPDAA